MGNSSRRSAGQSALAEFRRRRWAAIREAWRDWAVLLALAAAALITVAVADAALQLLASWLLGFLTAVAIVGWLIGGHVSSLPWIWGATGERQTAAELSKLPTPWRVVHDVSVGKGNWDHVAIGPPGVFVIDSKWLSRAAQVDGDGLRSGRIRSSGAAQRSQALKLREALARTTGFSGWVQAVVAVWGEFPQVVVEENKVVYLQATGLTEWLGARSGQLSEARIAQMASAIEHLAARP